MHIFLSQFRKLTYGYQNDSVNAVDTMKSIWELLGKRETRLLPGEGEPIVSFLKTTYDFLVKSQNFQDFHNSTLNFFRIIDILLQNSTSVLNEKVSMAILLTPLAIFYNEYSTKTERNLYENESQ